ncbi:MAG: DUF2520 domain-containing protein [Pseudomonadota bacterium]|nr:DUF2520 domain-containing protein [Pseudomonadota bacterium]
MRYVIFGNGRVGASIGAWLRHLGHRATTVARAEAAAQAPPVLAAIAEADVVAAAIPDGAIAAWRRAFAPALDGKRAIHFSGALLVDGLYSYHPLYSFPRTPLPPEAMNRIAFARQEGAPPLREIIPGAPNPEFAVADRDRAYYHALAVLSGNFAAYLWNETAKGLAGRLGLKPEEVLAGYLEGVVARFAESPFDSLTGPVARRDRASAEANLAALAGEPRLEALYRAFLASAWPDFGGPE